MPQFRLADYPFESVLMAIALLVLLSVVGSRFSARAGVPSLLVFLAIGMLAGSDGPGGIEFTNYPLTFVLGSVALAFIIFDGGLRTAWESVRPVLGVGVSLASVAVVATAALTGAFSHYALGLPWSEALLLGAIVSSTDAAAVFSVLRARSLALKGTVRQVLEFEAGSNDPMAVLLTLAVLSFIAAPGGAAPLAGLFATQVLVGLALGWAGGKAVVALINNVGIEYEGLYSVLLLAFVILLFAATAAVGGSGFLAAYLAGLVVGNAKLLHRSSLLKFHDGIAWIAQISLFLTLGLLVFPSHLPPVAPDGLILVAFLMFVARPLSVLVAAPTRRFHWKERLFISWVGLRGAAPILLATLPWSVGVPNAEYFFNLVFFVVLVSVLAQGTTISWLAKRLRLVERLREEPEEGAGILPAGFVFAEIEVRPGAPAEQRQLFELQLPSGVVLTSLEREGRYIVPAGETRFAAADRIKALARPSSIEKLRDTFGQAAIASSP
ncbi:MAG: K+/H+ antiporter [Betaproteobacteria bacterium RIFCSPLOWO2_12_FULL_65_14]|nr:MAG: K+/H+ antiporter [Betaproteobacteria bacterium RIFCSPLOWO2_12_FULL_65_14]